jgi:DNA ligase-1
MKPWEVIAELESDNSRNFKTEVICREAEADNTEFFRGCRAALDSMITYGVKKVTEKTEDGPAARGLKPEVFWNTAESLARRELTGNAAQSAVNHLRMNATMTEWNSWYRRILIKDLRCGMSEKTLNAAVADVRPEYVIPVFACQLAHDGANHESKITDERLVEVKLDGVRVITVVYPGGQVDQYSRNGKELINFPHIREQIAKHARWFSEPVVLDGEVMSASFQDLMRQVHRKSDVDASDAVLHLFDMVTLSEFRAGQGQHRQIDRSFSLKTWYDQIADHMPNVSVVGQELIDLREDTGQARFSEINAQALAAGMEGIMIKDPVAIYECKRTHNWLKIKPFIEVSLAVVDVEEGTGRNSGRLGALVCQGRDADRDITVNVGSGFSDSDRDVIWDSRAEIIGQIVEVRADAVTQNQDGSYSLRFPRFKTFRGFEPGEKL